MAPTASVIAGVDAPCESIDRAAVAVGAAQAAHFPALNAALARASLPSLPPWTPPAAPACGPK